MKNFLQLIVCLFLFNSCTHQRIETGRTLDTVTQNLIKSLGLLDDNESIIKYYSNYRKDKAGNFFTDKRISHYWLDEHTKDKNDTSFAFYKDISSIDTVYKVPKTFSPYMEITKKDSTKFRVYVDGSNEEIKSFFEGTLDMWNKQKLN